MNLAASAVVDSNGAQLDGSWTTSVSTFATGSGNGVAGSDFNFYFNVLPGDANNSGSVSNGDVLVTKLQVGAVTSSTNYRLDVNASGNITNGDVLLEKLQVGSNINSFANPQLPPQSELAVVAATLPAAAASGELASMMLPTVTTSDTASSVQPVLGLVNQPASADLSSVSIPQIAYATGSAVAAIVASELAVGPILPSNTPSSASIVPPPIAPAAADVLFQSLPDPATSSASVLAPGDALALAPIA
jgi:hypothetical protein